jgi:tetratricopeptide (TPR) repeat protein
VPGAWLGAALWALHPVQVESVAWITEMKNTESGLFYLLSTLFFLKWLGAGKAGERIQGDWNYVLTLVFAAMAMASKSSTVVLPAVLCLCAWWIEGRWQWRNLARVAPIFLMVLVSVAVSIWTQKLEGGIDPSMARAWPERFATAGGEVWFYLSKLVWPYPLITVYPRWKIDAGQWSSYLPLLAVIAGFSILWIKRGLWARPWFFVMAYFLVALLPVLGFVDHYFLQYSFVADHFQYLASMGPLALIGAGMGRLSDFIAPAKSWPRAAIATGVLLILGLLSWQKAWSYESDETLWNDTLALDPNSWVGYDNLGNALVREGKLNLAVEQYQKSMAINPTYAHTLSNLGTALSAIGRVDEAIVHYQKAIEIDPGNSIIHYDFGNILFQKGDMDGAMAQFQKAVDLHQDYAAAHNNMGNVLLREGRMDEALAQFQRALEIDPYYLESINNLGTAFLREGQFDEARVQFQKALAGNPNSDVIHCNLGNAFFRLGRMAEAVEQYQKAIEINPDNIAAQKNLPQAQAILQQQAGRK